MAAFRGLTWADSHYNYNTRFSLSMENEQAGAGRDGTGRLNPSRETKFSGAYGDRGILIFTCSADHEQDWQPYPVNPYSALCDDHIYIHTIIHTVLSINSTYWL